MATVDREKLHKMIDRVPDGDLVAALRSLEYLVDVGEHPAILAMLNAPVEDPEPDEMEMLDEVDAEIASGSETVSHDEVEKMFSWSGS